MAILRFGTMAITLAAVVQGTIPSVRLNDGTFLPMVTLGGGAAKGTVSEIQLGLQAGFRAIDTAWDYGNQKEVAEALRQAATGGIPRSALYIITKIPACLAEEGCADWVNLRHSTNVKSLGTTPNLLLVHYTPLSGCTDCGTIRAQWSAMEQLLAQNKTRTIGVSNYCRECIECLANATVQPAVNQFQYHVGMGPDPQGLVSYCHSRGIVPQAYSPLGPTDNTTAKDILIEGNLTNSVGRAYNKTGAQVALKWVAQHGSPLVTRASVLKYLQEDVDIFDFELSTADLGRLDAATAPPHAPCLFCTSGPGLR